MKKLSVLICLFALSALPAFAQLSSMPITTEGSSVLTDENAACPFLKDTDGRPVIQTGLNGVDDTNLIFRAGAISGSGYSIDMWPTLELDNWWDESTPKSMAKIRAQYMHLTLSDYRSGYAAIGELEGNANFTKLEIFDDTSEVQINAATTTIGGVTKLMLPTSTNDLTSGMLWNNGGNVAIVP